MRVDCAGSKHRSPVPTDSVTDWGSTLHSNSFLFVLAVAYLKARLSPEVSRLLTIRSKEG
jgi:hypothetical protein